MAKKKVVQTDTVPITENKSFDLAASLKDVVNKQFKDEQVAYFLKQFIIILQELFENDNV